jgi:AAA+ ATPase superfamily predicted ATPase
MEHRFIGRTRELQLLRELFKKKSASLVVIRGRRRIGKSRLAQEFSQKVPHYILSGLPPTSAISALDQREEFARQLQREMKIPLPRADDWGDLFWLAAKATQKGKVVLVLDEISWMGSKDPTFLGKLKTAWDLYFKSNPHLILILCGSISSWIEKNILSSTGFMGRISLDIILEELPLHECNEFWNAEQDRVSGFDKLKILSITGGVPRYLEEILPSQSAEANIQRLCFRKEGFLFSEFERIFSDLFSTRSATYKKIVKRLAEGPCELKGIYKALKMEKSGVISDYMEDLETAGFVSQDFTWHLKTGADSKLSHYRLKDNYLRFYLKYIEPNKKKIEKGNLKLLPQWQSTMGLQFENLVLSNRKAVQKILGIDPSEIVNDNPFFQRKAVDRPGCQIDYMIQTKFGTCYLCEIKFSSQKITTSVINEVKQKIHNLALPRNRSIKPVLIHVNGVDESVAEADFFSSIIDFNDLLHERV